MDFRKTAMTEVIGEITIDTADTPDMGWETGIKKENEWVIVEEYHSEKEAKEGHTSWINKIKANPNLSITNIRTPEEWFFG